jgi:hypothetical protein
MILIMSMENMDKLLDGILEIFKGIVLGNHVGLTFLTTCKPSFSLLTCDSSLTLLINLLKAWTWAG